MEQEQLLAYETVDALLDSAKFPEAIEKMRPWNKSWLHQFYETYPHRYRILQHTDFNDFWAERRAGLNSKVAFVAQKNISDIDFVLGYVFYLLVLKNEASHSKAHFTKYLKLALEFHSIHAAQTIFHEMIIKTDSDKTKQAACRLFLRNLPGHPSPRQGQKQATSMPPAALAVLVPLDFDPPSGLKIYAPQ